VKEAAIGVVAAVGLALGCSGAEPSEPPPTAADPWRACSEPADCSWTLGGGGWPTAVNVEQVSAHRDWVDSQAPFTTYHMPGDCFGSTQAFEAYVAHSRSTVVCRAGACGLAIEPTCAGERR